MADAEAPSPLALTMGEPAGIGSEIALKAWLGRRQGRLPAFVLLDDPAHLAAVARQLGAEVPIAEVSAPASAAGLFQDALPVLPLRLAREAVPGEPDPSNAAAVLEAIDQAVALALEGEVRGLVTNPIHKATLYRAGFRHQGHTDYLAALSGADQPPVMMLAAPGIRVAPVTVHLALRDAVAALTTDAIVAAGEVAARALVRDFGLAAPRLWVAGLNPHAGEAGNLGREELDIIQPAIDALRARGHLVEGPFAADAMFHEAARERYDAALCMYHDQALIPLKTLAFDQGVNVTLGLTVVRTSPDHGTALDIAGTGQAKEDSLVQALRLADEIAQARRRHDAGGHD
jgi:4-hydroxythreonine-4-phosphate dehydrogenase